MWKKVTKKISIVFLTALYISKIYKASSLVVIKHQSPPSDELASIAKICSGIRLFLMLFDNMTVVYETKIDPQKQNTDLLSRDSQLATLG